MARLQILELPEGDADDRPPFLLVVDECMPQRIALGADAPYRDYWQDLAQQIGARGVIVTPETVDIPANDTTAYIQQVAEEVGSILGNVTRSVSAQYLVDERTDIARDMDRLAKRRQELADALVISLDSTWEQIVDEVRERQHTVADLYRRLNGENSDTERSPEE